jgi:hypothetical protein
MPSLLATLNAAAGSMRVFDRALSMIQNNVSNASTPGYASQHIDLISLAFQPDLGQIGGVSFTHCRVPAATLPSDRSASRPSATGGGARWLPPWPSSNRCFTLERMVSAAP